MNLSTSIVLDVEVPPFKPTAGDHVLLGWLLPQDHRLVVFCTNCCCWHWHGQKPLESIGTFTPRSAHCAIGGAYVIFISGIADKTLMADMRRRRFARRPAVSKQFEAAQRLCEKTTNDQ